MPIVNPLAKNKNAAEDLLGTENADTQAKRGYAAPLNPATTITNRPINPNDIYNTKAVPGYISAEGARLRNEAAATNASRAAGGAVPSVGSVLASGLDTTDALRQAAVEAGGLPSTAGSSFAQQYQTRASAGINAIFGGASGDNKPDLNLLTPSELSNYQSLARTTGSIPTAEAAGDFQNLLPSEREKLRATIFAAKNEAPDLRGTGLSHTAIAGALRLAKYKDQQ